MTTPGLLVASIAGAGVLLGSIIVLTRRRQRRKAASASLAAKERVRLPPATLETRS